MIKKINLLKRGCTLLLMFFCLQSCLATDKESITDFYSNNLVYDQENSLLYVQCYEKFAGLSKIRIDVNGNTMKLKIKIVPTLFTRRLDVRIAFELRPEVRIIQIGESIFPLTEMRSVETIDLYSSPMVTMRPDSYNTGSHPVTYKVKYLYHHR